MDSHTQADKTFDRSRGWRITEPLAAPGVGDIPPVTALAVVTAVIADEPVIVLIEDSELAVIDGDNGQLLVDDVVGTTVRAHGGHRLTLPPDLSAPPTSGWLAQIDARTIELLVHLPSGIPLYDGNLGTPDPDWLTAVALRGHRMNADHEAIFTNIVMVTGPMKSIAEIESVVCAERATWIRIPLIVRV